MFLENTLKKHSTLIKRYLYINEVFKKETYKNNFLVQTSKVLFVYIRAPFLSNECLFFLIHGIVCREKRGTLPYTALGAQITPLLIFDFSFFPNSKWGPN